MLRLLVVRFRLVQEFPKAVSSRAPTGPACLGGIALDEVGLVRARCVDWGGRGGGLAGTAQRKVGAAEDGCEGGNGQLDVPKSQHLGPNGSVASVEGLRAGSSSQGPTRTRGRKGRTDVVRADLTAKDAVVLNHAD